MAQKINPTSTRLGKQVFWQSLSQNYGGKLTYPTFFYPLILQLFFLLQLKKEKTIFLFSLLKFLPSTSVFTFSVSLPKMVPKAQVKIFQNGLKIYKVWGLSNVTSLIFFNSSFSKSAQFMSIYFKFLLSENFLFRKALSIILFNLKQQIGQSKLTVSKSGVRKITLKGFKVVLAGRFENTKTQMAKKVSYKFGALSLNSLNSFVEYSAIDVNSPLGLYNFKVWLFYY